MKKNILILGGRYANPIYANSICRQNIAEFFVKEGHKVFVLAYGFEYRGEEETLNGVWVRKEHGDNYGNVLRHRKNVKGFFANVSFRFKQFWHYSRAIYYYPSSSDGDFQTIFKHSKEIIEHNNIDTLIAMYRPYDSIKVALKLKSEYGYKLKVVTYHLDLMFEHLNANPFVVAYKQWKIQKAFNKELLLVDKILLPGSASYIDEEKVEYVDFPLYIPEESEECLDCKNKYFVEDTINIAIVGTLDKINRNPAYICHLIEQMPPINGKLIVLHIWGAQKDVDYNQYNRTIYHGMADVKEVPAILKSCDILLNVGNRITSTMIPSKIFQMFAAKKPIIFNVSSSQDKSIPYFRKYGYTCFIKEYEHQEKSDSDMMELFIRSNYHRVLNVDDLLFEKSTPRYICKKILDD